MEIIITEDHKYMNGDIEIPGVTTVLQDVGIINYGPFVTTGKGTRLHKIIELYRTGQLNWETISDEEIEYIQRFDQLTGKYEFAEYEKQLYNPVYHYAGTCDFSFGLWIGELKTGKPEAWHLLQLAAYCYIEKKAGVLIYPGLKRNPIREYTFPELKEAFKHFLCALDVYNYKRLN